MLLNPENFYLQDDKEEFKDIDSNQDENSIQLPT